jgi:uncharacterized protein (TIGR02588 family)
VRRRTAIAEHTKQSEEDGTGAARSAPNDQREPDTGNPKDGESDTPPLEWAIACVGLMLVVTSVGFLLYKAIWKEASPPQITVRVISIVPVQNGYLVQFETMNSGGSTAEGVVIGGELRRGAERVESSQTTVDYLPSNSKKAGGLFFTQDPRQFDFHARALGYEDP